VTYSKTKYEQQDRKDQLTDSSLQLLEPLPHPQKTKRKREVAKDLKIQLRREYQEIPLKKKD